MLPNDVGSHCSLIQFDSKRMNVSRHRRMGQEAKSDDSKLTDARHHLCLFVCLIISSSSSRTTCLAILCFVLFSIRWLNSFTYTRCCTSPSSSSSRYATLRCLPVSTGTTTNSSGNHPSTAKWICSTSHPITSGDPTSASTTSKFLSRLSPVVWRMLADADVF